MTTPFDPRGNGHDGAVLRMAPAPDRMPPHSIPAEQGTLGSILCDATVLPAIRADLAPGHFFRDVHAEIYRVVLDLDDRGIPVDAMTLAEELIRRGVSPRTEAHFLVGELFDSVAHAANGPYYAAIVRDAADRRALIEDAQARIEDIGRGQVTTEQVLGRSAERLGRIEPVPEFGDDVLGLVPWPEGPDPMAWYGLPGDLVRLMAPHTEADPVAVLGQLLVAYGNVIGRKAHWRAGPTEHYCNLYLCIVGDSSVGRKGESWDATHFLLRACDSAWVAARVKSGLASGEGMITTVKDPTTIREKVKGVPMMGGGGYRDVEVDPGVADKRALWVETEFAATLRVLNREGNSLSGWIRKAFDSGTLASETKGSPVRATGAHVSIIGHSTPEELRTFLTDVEAVNGFANRFLWLCARRSQCLPDGGQLHTVNWTDAFRRLAEAVAFGKGEGADDFIVVRDPDARALWHEVYPGLTTARPGLLGRVTARAAPLVMRLAAVYALMDLSPVVRRDHLRAALAFWRYGEASARYIFGDGEDVATGADAAKVREALRAAGDAGLTGTQLRRQVFRGHKTKRQIEAILAPLVRQGVVRVETVPNPKGAPAATVVKAVRDFS